MTRRPLWAAAGLQLHPNLWPGARLATGLGSHWDLGPEHARTLAAALLRLVGDSAGPADPDAVRLAIDEQRAVLRERSSAPDTTEEARTELAWASRALDEVAAAAGGAS